MSNMMVILNSCIRNLRMKENSKDNYSNALYVFSSGYELQCFYLFVQIKDAKEEALVNHMLQMLSNGKKLSFIDHRMNIAPQNV